MVVGEDRDRLEVPGCGDDGELLEQTPRILSVAELNALARGRKSRPDSQVGRDVGGDGAMLPRTAFIRGRAHLRVQHATVIGVDAGVRAHQPDVCGANMEAEDRPGCPVHHITRVGEAADRSTRLTGMDGRLGLPGAATVGGTALQDRVGSRSVDARGAAVIGSQQVTTGRDGQGGDAVVREDPVATHGERLLRVAGPASPEGVERSIGRGLGWHTGRGQGDTNHHGQAADQGRGLHCTHGFSSSLHYIIGCPMS